MSRTNVILAVGAAAALLAACSSSTAKSGPSTTPSASPPSSTAPVTTVTSASSTVAASTTPVAATSSVAAAALSGSWRGTYSGAYSGTFVLRWAQASSKLTGTIDLSTAPGAVTINGTVVGGRIQFGTVGSQAITYTGSVAGNSMSGGYTIAGGASGSGTWRATRG